KTRNRRNQNVSQRVEEAQLVVRDESITPLSPPRQFGQHDEANDGHTGSDF
ncbi:hypothetical protein CEXT_265561, partial [Caerostris extrusa]